MPVYLYNLYSGFSCLQCSLRVQEYRATTICTVDFIYSLEGHLVPLGCPVFPDHDHGPLTRYVKLQVAHAPRMSGTFSPPPQVSNPDMHHGTCVAHVPWCMPGSLTSGFLWIRLRGKRSRHSRRMRNPQLYVSGKRPTTDVLITHWALVMPYGVREYSYYLLCAKPLPEPMLTFCQ